MDRIFYVIAGGTFVEVAPHFSFSAPAFGTVGRELAPLLAEALVRLGQPDARVQLVLTRMALGGAERSTEERAFFARVGIKDLRTNEDVQRLVDHLVADPTTKGIVLAAALTDFQPSRLIVDGHPSSQVGRERSRLESSKSLVIEAKSTPKVLASIRRERKDLFLVGFKTTSGVEADVQYLRGLALVKGASCNLVLANDLKTRLNMVITPEQARYHETTNRAEALAGLAEMIALRSQLTFTRATIVPGEAVSWGSELVAPSLREVVNHCIARGAYKPFNGVTVGHFASRGPNGNILTSRRKTDFNRLDETGLVLIEPRGEDEVIARGFKPSVGGQSQRIIFEAHPELDCIVHMHSPLRPGSMVPVREQRPYECGSHECGRNTNDGLANFDGIHAVMLDKHGPNIVFPKTMDPAKVIAFIEANVDLAGRTDGLTA